MSNINQTRLENILKLLANGHYTQSQLMGDLATLSTDEKTSLVKAINELATKVQAASSATNETEVNRLIDAKIADLVGGAPAALDTLKEIADKLANDDTATAAILAEIAALKAQEAFAIPDEWHTNIQNIMNTGAA